MKLAGVTVLYDPDSSVEDNIASYIDDVDKLYIVDNSKADNSARFCGDKLCYISNGENLGIAAALNIGAKRAIEDGFLWLLTMDQDSSFSKGSIPQLAAFINESESPDKIGIVSPLHKTGIELGIAYERVDSPDTVMTSGNIVNLGAYSAVGGFKDWMFIDAVDFDFCLNLRKHGYEILRLTYVELCHRVGDMIEGKFLSKTVYSLNHSPMRRYYIVRNRHYFYDMYKDDFPEYCKAELGRTLPEVIKLILFEKDKIKKLRAMHKGYRDYKKGIKGNSYKIK